MLLYILILFILKDTEEKYNYVAKLSSYVN